MYMIHHVFLPPRLPQSGDGWLFGSTDRVLLQFLSETLALFSLFVAPGQNESVLAIKSMIDKLIFITDDKGHIHQNLLLEAFAELSLEGTVILLHILHTLH